MLQDFMKKKKKNSVKNLYLKISFQPFNLIVRVLKVSALSSCVSSMFLQVSHFRHSFNSQHNKFITTGCDLISLQYLIFNVFNFIGLDFLYRVQHFYMQSV